MDGLIEHLVFYVYCFTTLREISHLEISKIKILHTNSELKVIVGILVDDFQLIHHRQYELDKDLHVMVH